MSSCHHPTSLIPIRLEHWAAQRFLLHTLTTDNTLEVNSYVVCLPTQLQWVVAAVLRKVQGGGIASLLAVLVPAVSGVRAENPAPLLAANHITWKNAQEKSSQHSLLWTVCCVHSGEESPGHMTRNGIHPKARQRLLASRLAFITLMLLFLTGDSPPTSSYHQTLCGGSRHRSLALWCLKRWKPWQIRTTYMVELKRKKKDV